MKALEYLLCGGTGTLGKAITKEILKREGITDSGHYYRGIRIFSRDEFKQWEMKKQFKGYENISYLIGDIRDEKRLEMAMRGVDVVINCAAMKQVPACEENPIEAVKTNIEGSENIIRAAIKSNVKKVLHISTDKAVEPINLYGMTKGVAEKLFLQSNTYDPGGTMFSCCRYGNVLGSRGSIIPLFKESIINKGEVNVTHKEMTRFWIRIERVAKFILDRVENMEPGKIYIPKMKTMSILRVVDAMAMLLKKSATVHYTGIRQGEKLHEVMINEYESQFADEHEDYFTLDYCKNTNDHFIYSSDKMEQFNPEEFQDQIKDLL